MKTEKITLQPPDWNKEIQVFAPPRHKDLLRRLSAQIKPIDFRALAGLKENSDKLTQKHFLVIIIEQILQIAQHNNWGLCIKNGAVYIYNGRHWNMLSSGELQTFLGESAERFGAGKFHARYYSFREQLSKQFLATANLPTPEDRNDIVLLNLLNGTMEVSLERQVLRPAAAEDFLTYTLPFDYDKLATAPLFQAFLDRVQPNTENQKILAEFLGCLFISPSTLKLEKTLLLHGGGANGKSVFFEVVNALLGGNENVSNYSLDSLTDRSGYYRAMLANKLLNYASEINGKLEVDIFKQLVSGEPVEARLPYGNPFIMSRYAKLIFNCNELPKDIEHTHAFFRRLIIIPFEVTIPESEQDKQLSAKIIRTELSGVFNWVLNGLKRLLENKSFTYSENVIQQIEQYKLQSDSVRLFLADGEYRQSVEKHIALKDLFQLYRGYCSSCCYHPCSLRTFSDRIKQAGFAIVRKSNGMMVYAESHINDALI